MFHVHLKSYNSNNIMFSNNKFDFFRTNFGRLKRGDNVGAESFESCTVYFSDIPDFGDISANSDPLQIVVFLNDLYNFMDSRIDRFDVYKVRQLLFFL